MRIEAGYGLEGRITDGRAGEILDTYAVPRFKSGEYDRGLLDGFLAIKGDVQKEYGTEAGGEETPSDSLNLENISDRENPQFRTVWNNLKFQEEKRTEYYSEKLSSAMLKTMETSSENYSEDSSSYSPSSDSSSSSSSGGGSSGGGGASRG